MTLADDARWSGKVHGQEGIYAPAGFKRDPTTLQAYQEGYVEGVATLYQAMLRHMVNHNIESVSRDFLSRKIKIDWDSAE